VPVDPTARLPGCGCWWDVPVSEVSEQETVKRARRDYEDGQKKQRWFV
jgi:TPP-dependent trihydroxycyclohexane-1,2-dione (THcHDO) dehydratase